MFQDEFTGEYITRYNSAEKNPIGGIVINGKVSHSIVINGKVSHTQIREVEREREKKQTLNGEEKHKEKDMSVSNILLPKQAYLQLAYQQTDNKCYLETWFS